MESTGSPPLQKSLAQTQSTALSFSHGLSTPQLLTSTVQSHSASSEAKRKPAPPHCMTKSRLLSLKNTTDLVARSQQGQHHGLHARPGKGGARSTRGGGDEARQGAGRLWFGI
eukprot:269300-Pelagomonas_calceolata.AAC.9